MEATEDLTRPLEYDTLRNAAEGALTMAEAEDLLGVVVPACGLPEADAAMLDAVASIPTTAGVPIVAWRGATGHSGLASELAEVVLSIEAVRAGRLPGTAGLVAPLSVPDHPLPTKATEGPGRAVLVLSAGLQGEASAVVVSAIDAPA